MVVFVSVAVVFITFTPLSLVIYTDKTTDKVS